MAKHPKTFQTVEGRALNTKRSLISIATMAAFGLVASTGSAANVQYDGLGIKPQFQDYAKKHSHIMVGGNFSSYGPYENNQPIYTSDRYGDHGVGFNQDIYKYCTYGDVKLNYTQKTFDDAIKQNVAKPRGFHIYAGGLVFGSVGVSNDPRPDVGGNRTNVYGSTYTSIHNVGSEDTFFKFDLYGGGGIHSNLGEAIVEGDVNIDLQKVYSQDGYIIGGGQINGYNLDPLRPASNANADVMGDVNISIKHSRLSCINGGSDITGDGKTNNIHANVGANVNIDLFDSHLIGEDEESFGAFIGGSSAVQLAIANVGKNVNITAKKSTMDILIGGGNTADELYGDEGEGYVSQAGKEAVVKGDVNLTLENTTVKHTLVVGGFTDVDFYHNKPYNPKDGRYGDASVGGNTTVTLLGNSQVKDVYMAGYGKGADVKGHAKLIIADTDVKVIDGGVLHGQGQVKNGKYTSTAQTSSLIFGTDKKGFDGDFKGQFQDFDFFVATKKSDVELDTLSDNNHGRLNADGLGSLLTIKGAGEFEVKEINLSNQNNLVILGDLETDVLKLNNATITVAKGGEFEVDDFSSITNGGKVTIEDGAAFATLSNQIFNTGLDTNGTEQSAGSLKSNSPVTFEQGSSLTITDAKYNLTYADSAYNAFNTGTKATKPNLSFTGTLVGEKGQTLTEVSLNQLNHGVHESVDIKATDDTSIADKAIGGKTLKVEQGASVNVANNGNLTLVGENKADQELIAFDEQATNKIVNASGEGAGLVLGSTTKASAGKISAKVTISHSANLTTQNGDFALNDVTLSEKGQINVGNGNLNIEKLTVQGDTTIANTETGSTSVKEFSVAGRGTTTITGEITTDKLQVLDRANGGATINVGRNEARGDLTIKDDSSIAGLTFFLDPTWVEGKEVTDASRLVLPKSELDANVIVGHNSYVVLGSNSDDAFLQLFKDRVLTWGDKTDKGQVLAAAYIAKPLTVKTGSLMVDASQKGDTQPTAGAAGSVSFGANSVMVGDISGLTSENVLITADSFNVNKTSKAVIIGDLKKDQVYKLTNAQNVNFWNTKDTLISGNQLWELTINQDGTFSTKLNDAYKVFGNAMQGHDLANAGVQSTVEAERRYTNALLTDATASLSKAAIAARFDAAMNVAGAAATFTTAYDRASEFRDAVRGEAIAGEGNRLWAQVTGGKTKLKGISTGAQGLHVDTDAYGLVIGGDTVLNGYTVGAAFTAGKGDSENKAVGVKDSFDFYGLSVHGKTAVGGVDLVADASMTFLKSDLTMGGVADVNTDTDTTVYSMGVQAKKSFDLGVDVTPYVGLDLYHLRADGYSNGHGADVEDANATALEIPVGATVSKSFDTASGFKLKPVFHFAIVPTVGDRDIDSKIRFAGAQSTYNFTFADDVKVRTGLGLAAEKDNFRFGFNAGYDWGNEERAATKLMLHAQYLF